MMEQYLNQIIDLFTPAQRLALVVITASVMSLTQVFKKVYFGFWPERRKTRKSAIIWLFSFIAGSLCGLAGYYIGAPQQPMWFWLFCGVSSGGIAIGMFKLIIEIIWPRLVIVVKKPV